MDTQMPLSNDPALRVNIDVETKSTVDLRKTSAKIYARDPSTDIILVRYCRESEPDKVGEWLCYRDPMPLDLRAYMDDEEITLVAHNAGFEIAILNSPHLRAKYRIPATAIERWDDTAARAARMAIPRSLDGSAKALELPVKKDIEGSRIMMQLCKPRAWTEDDEPVWWTPEDSPDKYEKLSDYCATDVKVGALLSKATRPLTASELAIWRMTEEINETGLYVDWRFAEAAARVAKIYRNLLDSQMAIVTGGAVQGAGKVTQLKEWCAARGYMVQDAVADDKIILDKGAIATLLARTDLPDDVRAALTIRRDAAKSSVAKYEAILNRVDRETSRVRDTIVYHGASTGRWAGSGIQPQNFPRAVVKDWEATAADVYKLDKGTMDFEEFEAKHGPVMDVLSKMLRGTITAPKGSALIFPDYAAIEARGVAWLAGASKLVNLFAAGGKVYEEFAAENLSPPGTTAADILKDSLERFLAKTAILGAGYGMGSKKFVSTTTAQGADVTDEDGVRAINAYRTAYPEIPALWKGLENAAIAAVMNPGVEHTYQGNPNAPKVTYLSKGGWLLCKLPSGRLLFYKKPRIVQIASPFGPRMALEYSAQNAVTKKWERETTWGGKLTENVVQAVCRDLIALAMLRVKDAGYLLVGTVHDEIIAEVPHDDEGVIKGIKARIIEIICQKPAWAKGFPIAAEAGHGKRYGK
jgi:DNA polymerase